MELKHICLSKKQIVCILLCALVALLLIPSVFLQNQYLSTGLFTKEIVSVEYAAYDSQLLRSAVTAQYSISREDHEALFARFEKQNNYCDVRCFVDERDVHEVLFLTLRNGDTVVCYVKDDLLGIDFGRVWVHNAFLHEFIQTIQTS